MHRKSSMETRGRSVSLISRRLLVSNFLTPCQERTTIQIPDANVAALNLAPTRASRTSGKRSFAGLMTVATNSNRISTSFRGSTPRWRTTSSYLTRKSACVTRRSTAFRSSLPVPLVSLRSAVTLTRSRLRIKFLAKSAKSNLSIVKTKNCLPR